MAYKSRKILFYTLSLSVLIHLLVLPTLRPGRSHMGDVEPARPLTIVREPMPTPKPTPRATRTPRPRTHTVVRPHQKPHVAVRLPPQHYPPRSPDMQPPGAAIQQPGNGNGNKVNGTDALPGTDASGPPATSVPIATPSPSPTPTKPACANPTVAASTVHVVEPDTPPMAQQQGITGEVTVVVSLDEHSRLIDARVSKSPSTILNAAALRSARETTYRTEVRDCKPIAAEYLFVIEFASQ